MLPLTVVLACTTNPPSTARSPDGNRGSSSLEAADPTHAPDDGAGDDVDTGKFEYGVVTNIRMGLPSEAFVVGAGEWFTVEFALVDDAGDLQDHWETLVPVTLDCDGEMRSVGGVADVVGRTAVSLGGSLNPRDSTVMLLEACESARLDALMVAYQGTPPFHAFSDFFEVR